MLSTSLVMSLLPIFTKEVGAADVYISLVVAGYWVSRIILEVHSDLISSKFGYYHSMSIGFLLTAIGNILCALADNPVRLILARADGLWRASLLSGGDDSIRKPLRRWLPR